MRTDNPGLGVYVRQPNGVLDQPAPVNGTFYPLIGTLLEGEKNARVYNIAINIEDTDENLELHVIVDGITDAGVQIPATHSNSYRARKTYNAITRVSGIVFEVDLLSEQSFLFEGREVQVLLRKTTAAGAGNLTGIATWGRKEN